jgi:phage antirepressor YoqD-like protein
MIDLNQLNIPSGEKKYNLAETAKILKLGFGRNTLYRILKELEIVNEDNVPAKKYQEQGLLEIVVIFLQPNPRYVNHPKTLVVGQKGLNFIDKVVKEYLEKNPIPKQPRRKRGEPYEDSSGMWIL